MNQDQLSLYAAIAQSGIAITFNKKTGDPCPCATSGDGGRVGYSAEWHRENPDADHCNGSLIINASVSVINCKTLLYNADQIKTDELKAMFGELQPDDIVINVLLNSSDWSEIDMSGISEQDDTFTYNGNTYVLRQYKDLQVSDSFCQVGLLKRIA